MGNTGSSEFENALTKVWIKSLATVPWIIISYFLGRTEAITPAVEGNGGH